MRVKNQYYDTMLSQYLIRGWRDASVTGLLVALVCGLMLPAVFSSFQTYSTILLQAVFFISSLSIDFRGVWSEFRSWKTLAWVTVWMLVLLPILIFLIIKPFFPMLALPLLLLAAMPVGMTTPFLAQLLRLNTSLALALTLTTSLLAPITVPAVIQFMAGFQHPIEISHLSTTLVQVIVIPFVLAQCIRWLVPGVVQGTKILHKPCSLLLVGLLIAAIAGQYHAALLSCFTLEYGLGLMVLTLFFLGVHLLGYWLAWWRNERDRLTITFAVVYMNFTLAIFMAEKFFADPTVIFYAILSILPWNIGMFIFQRVIHGRFSRKVYS